MSFSEDQFTAKLNSLDETQESIVSASKWLLSQYKEVNKVANCWKKFILKPATNTRRKLLAIYLANDVIQQSKHQRIGEFGAAFGSIMPEVLGKVYPELTHELRKKVKRVVDIWKQRQVFSESVFRNLYPQLKEPKISSSHQSTASEIVPELRRLAEIYAELAKSQAAATSSKTRFDTLEALDPSSAVYMENYKTVSKIGQTAKDALQKLLSTRKKAIGELEMMLNLQNEQSQQDEELVNEIDEILASKDPARVSAVVTEESDLLPTYEANDGSDSDTDHSDIEEAGVSRKRSSSGESSNIESKRIKTEISTTENANTNTETEAYEPTPAEVAANSPLAVTSSIQDLLSKLAN